MVTKVSLNDTGIKVIYFFIIFDKNMIYARMVKTSRSSGIYINKRFILNSYLSIHYQTYVYQLCLYLYHLESL